LVNNSLHLGFNRGHVILVIWMLVVSQLKYDTAEDDASVIIFSVEDVPPSKARVEDWQTETVGFLKPHHLLPPKTTIAADTTKQ
jgi:hypothetical protein